MSHAPTKHACVFQKERTCGTLPRKKENDHPFQAYLHHNNQLAQKIQDSRQGGHTPAIYRSARYLLRAGLQARIWSSQHRATSGGLERRFIGGRDLASVLACRPLRRQSIFLSWLVRTEQRWSLIDGKQKQNSSVRTGNSPVILACAKFSSCSPMNPPFTLTKSTPTMNSFSSIPPSCQVPNLLRINGHTTNNQQLRATDTDFEDSFPSWSGMREALLAIPPCRTHVQLPLHRQPLTASRSGRTAAAARRRLSTGP